MPPLTVDLAFVIHPRHGIVAALDVEHPALPIDVLRRHGFTSKEGSDFFHADSTTKWDEAIHNAQRVMAEFTTIGYVVGTSPEFDRAAQTARTPNRSAPSDRPARPEAAGTSVIPWTDLIAQATSAKEISDLIEHLTGNENGALARLHEALETAATWCENNGAGAAATALRDATDRLSDLGDDLDLVHGDLAQADTSEWADRATVARAATANSPKAGSHTSASSTHHPERPAPSAAPGSRPGTSRPRSR